jgi:hypothetical protein
MTTLGDFLRQRLAWPRKAGEHDCATLPAAWAMQRGRVDPMASWRGYSSEAEAEEIIFDAGGLVTLFEASLIAVGCKAVEEPQEGDIGVLSIAGEEAGSIFTGSRWVLVTDCGLAFVAMPTSHVSRVWRP